VVKVELVLVVEAGVEGGIWCFSRRYFCIGKFSVGLKVVLELEGWCWSWRTGVGMRYGVGVGRGGVRVGDSVGVG